MEGGRESDDELVLVREEREVKIYFFCFGGLWEEREEGGDGCFG